MSKPDSAWSQQRISEFLAFEELGYQKIELPYGLATPGVERRYLYDIAFGNQLSGESVLDVGSYLGAFCIESLKRGAGAAVGLELNRERIRQARAIAEILALKPEYRQLDIETCSLDGTFDITLCLNVLHHLRDPVRVLYELTEVTKRKLVLEFAAFGRRDRRKNKVGRISARVFARHPSIYVASGNPDKRNQTFFFSPHAVARLLDGHKKQYHTVTVMKSEDFKERCVIVAEKLRIRKLTVVSGPTSSGKSTLMESLMGGGEGDLAQSQLVMRDPHIVHASDVSNNQLRDVFPSADVKHVVYHYDTVRMERLGLHAFHRDCATELLRCADEVRFVFLAPKKSTLLTQLQASEIDGKPFKKTRWYRALLKLYEGPRWLSDHYQEWLAFCEAFPGANKRYFAYMEQDDGQRCLASTTIGQMRAYAISLGST